MKFTVKNVKCGGCAATIQTALKETEGVSNVDVEITPGIVDVTTQNDDDSTRAALSQQLSDLGFPEV